MRYLRLQILVFAALLATLTAIHCLPTEAQADRRRRWTTYGSARDRLVVACDMTSDTCSDGRKITTVRATPVPCETSPGVWEMVPEDTGCYSVRGLESWAQATSYLSYGAELDREPWGVAQSTLEKLDSFYRLSGATSSSRIFQSGFSPEEGVWTLSCIMQTSGSDNPRLRLYQEGASGGGFCNLDSSDGFSTYSCTQTVTGTPTHMSIHVYSGIGYIDVAGCWLTRTDTPGRPCWGGEAPVTCAADRHTISTEGWPTEAGEICISAEVGADATINRWLIDGRGPGETGNSRLVVRQGTNVLALLGPQGLVEGGTVTAGQHRLCVHASGNTIRLSVDGVVVAQGDAVAPMTWFPMATIGSAYPTTGGTEIDGSISSIRVRSFE